MWPKIMSGIWIENKFENYLQQVAWANQVNLEYKRETKGRSRPCGTNLIKDVEVNEWARTDPEMCCVQRKQIRRRERLTWLNVAAEQVWYTQSVIHVVSKSLTMERSLSESEHGENYDGFRRNKGISLLGIPRRPAEECEAEERG